MQKKTTTILASILISLASIGTGLGSWVYNSTTEGSTNIKDDQVKIDKFKFSTLVIKESENSASGLLSKIGNTVHNYRCDDKDLGYTNAVIDVCEYFSITSDDESNLSKARYKVVEGSGSISGDELTFGDIAGNVVVRCYEEGCEDNYFDLTFVNSVSTSIAEHQYKSTYGTIAWGNWSTTATYLSNDQHTRSRTGTLPYETKCEICSTKKDSGNLTIDESNYSTYSVYNTDSNTYIKTESCTKDSGTYIDSSRSTSYGTKTYTGYSQYSSRYHKHNYSRSYTTSAGYGSGYKYYCTDCSHLMEDTRSYYSKSSGTQNSYDLEAHSFSSDDSITYGNWEDYSSTQHRRLVTTTTTKTCTDCGYSSGSGATSGESYEYGSHKYGAEIITYCKGTFVKQSPYGLDDGMGNITYSWKCNKCGATKQSATGGTCNAKTTTTSYDCIYCGHSKF